MNKEIKEKIKRIEKQANIYLKNREEGEENSIFQLDVEADNIILAIASEINARVTKTFLETIKDISEDISYILDSYILEDNIKSVDELKGLLTEIELEPDVYTSDLTEWLNEDIKNVYFLSEALQEFNPIDGFKALSQAQATYKRQILEEVIKQVLGGEDEQR